MDSRPHLVRSWTRRELRQLATSSVIREIDGWWQDEGFEPSGADHPETSSRRHLFWQYEDSVDWTDAQHVSRAIRVFQEALAYAEDEALPGLKGRLELDGWTLEGRRIVRAVGPTRAPDSVAALSDPSAVLDAFDRTTRTLPDQPWEAIGAAKELMESTAKIVLRDLGEPVDETGSDVPKLVQRAQAALGLRAGAAQPGPDGSEAVKRTLGGLASVALGIVELRNRGFGSGHGPTVRPVGLRPRHAHLAVGAAHTWCRMMLDTLADPEAPWRARAVPAQA